MFVLKSSSTTPLQANEKYPKTQYFIWERFCALSFPLQAQENVKRRYLSGSLENQQVQKPASFDFSLYAGYWSSEFYNSVC